MTTLILYNIIDNELNIWFAESVKDNDGFPIKNLRRERGTAPSPFMPGWTKQHGDVLYNSQPSEVHILPELWQTARFKIFAKCVQYAFRNAQDNHECVKLIKTLTKDLL